MVTQFIDSARQFLAMLGSLKRNHSIPPLRALRLFLRYRRSLGVSRSDFFELWLWDETISEVDRLRFLATGDRIKLEDYINPRDDLLLLRDKARGNEVFTAAGARCTRILAVVSPNEPARTNHKTITSLTELREVLTEPTPTGVVCKPLQGMQADGVEVFVEAGPDSLTHFDGSRWSIERLWSILAQGSEMTSEMGRTSAWQLEHREAPHPDLEQLFGPTLGCLRLMTVGLPDGRMEVLQPMLKIPVGGRGVDVSDSTLRSMADWSTELLGPALDSNTMLWHDSHPITGVRITGTRIPFLAEARRTVVAAMAAFPRIRSLGFDVGVTASGPVIIEANPCWGSSKWQSTSRTGLMAGAFLEMLDDIDPPRFMRREERRL